MPIKTLSSAVLAALVGLLAGCASGPERVDDAFADDAPIAAESATLVVHGMSCPLCANNVDEQLLDLPGVTAVQVDMGSGEVAVRFAPEARVSRRQLAAAIDRSGFTLAELRVP